MGLADLSPAMFGTGLLPNSLRDAANCQCVPLLLLRRICFLGAVMRRSRRSIGQHCATAAQGGAMGRLQGSLTPSSRASRWGYQHQWRRLWCLLHRGLQQPASLSCSSQ